MQSVMAERSRQSAGACRDRGSSAQRPVSMAPASRYHRVIAAATEGAMASASNQSDTALHGGGQDAEATDAGAGDVSLLAEFPSADGELSAIIDEEGGVCYAYLRYRGRLVAHAWLYNRGDPPQGELSETDVPPVKNPARYVTAPEFALPTEEAEFSVTWPERKEKGSVCCILNLRGHPIAEFQFGERVGFSLLARTGNRLARPLARNT